MATNSISRYSEVERETDNKWNLETDIKKMNTYGKGMLVCLIAILISTPILAFTIGIWFFVPFGMLFAILMFFSFKVEGIKKEYNVQTYKEIIAFIKGEELNATDKIKEEAKRPYQKIVLAIASFIIAAVICGGIAALLLCFFK